MCGSATVKIIFGSLKITVSNCWWLTAGEGPRRRFPARSSNGRRFFYCAAHGVPNGPDDGTMRTIGLRPIPFRFVVNW